MSFLNGTQLEVLAPRALRKGDIIETPRGQYTVLGNNRKKGELKFKGINWTFPIRRKYESIARAMGI